MGGTRHAAADARKKVVWSILLFGIVTCLNLYLPKLWPSAATGLYYGSGVFVHWTMALRPFRNVPVQVVDISKLVDKKNPRVDPESGETSYPFDRYKLAKLVRWIGQPVHDHGRHYVLGLAIDNDFSIDGQPELPGERELFRAALELQDQGVPVAFGVRSGLAFPPDERFHPSVPADPSDPESVTYAKKLRNLQASMYLRRRNEFDSDAGKILGPHWAPVEHRFRLAGEQWDVLPSFAGRLVPKRLWAKENNSFWLESGHREEHEGITHTERVIDLGLIGLLEGQCIRAREDGMTPARESAKGGVNAAGQTQFDNKYVILAAVDDPQPHDKFNIAGFGTTSGGVVQGAAIASLINGRVYELSTPGNVCVDLLTTVLIAVIAHMVVRKRPRRRAAEHRIEMSWTLLVVLITLLVSVLLAWLGSILWYHSLNFVTGHVMLLSMNWLVTRNPERLKSSLGRLVQYWFLGENPT